MLHRVLRCGSRAQDTAEVSRIRDVARFGSCIMVIGSLIAMPLSLRVLPFGIRTLFLAIGYTLPLILLPAMWINMCVRRTEGSLRAVCYVMSGCPVWAPFFVHLAAGSQIDYVYLILLAPIIGYLLELSIRWRRCLHSIFVIEAMFLTFFDNIESLQFAILGPPFRQPYFSVLVVTLILRISAGSILMGCVALNSSRLRDALKAQQKATEVQATFLSSVSHELRTPLNGIVGNMTFLKKTTAGDSETEELLHDMEYSAAIMMGVVNDILDIAKINNCKMVVRNKVVQLAAIVNGAFQSVRVLFPGSVTVDINIEESLPEFVVLDGIKLRQILVYFLSNAAKFAARGTVKVEAFHSDDICLQICVTDTGNGIPESLHATIFEQFVQGDHGVQGTGLGLPICKTFAEMMGGEIGFESSDYGTKFWVKLPLETIIDEKVATQSPTESQYSCSGLRMLVVEDNLVNQRLMRKMLQTLECTCIMASNGQEAIELFAQNYRSIDCILMDCNMPILDGFEATKEIRKTTAGNSVKIVAVTANVMDEDQVKCREAGMDGFIEKPLVTASLAEELARLNVKYIRPEYVHPFGARIHSERPMFDTVMASSDSLGTADEHC